MEKRQKKQKPGGNDEHGMCRTHDIEDLIVKINGYNYVPWTQKIMVKGAQLLQTKKVRMNSWTWGKQQWATVVFC